jgi:hypothetical protein
VGWGGEGGGGPNNVKIIKLRKEEKCLYIFNVFDFWWHWGLNSGAHAW